MTREQAINSMISHGFTVEQAGEIFKAVTLQEPTTKNDLGVDCISRQAVLNLFNKSDDYGWEMSLLKRNIEKMPSVTPQEPRKGHWIGIDEELHEDYECSYCGYVVSTFTANIKPHTEYKYCPNCGAKMESEE